MASYVIVSLPYSMLKQEQLQLADASFRDHDHGLSSKKSARNKEMKTHKEDKVTKRGQRLAWSNTLSDFLFGCRDGVAMRAAI